jgi:hypothetical protein
MRRAPHVTRLYELVCERYPHLPHVVKGKLAKAAERLLGADLCDREAQVQGVNLAIEAHLREQDSTAA